MTAGTLISAFENARPARLAGLLACIALMAAGITCLGSAEAIAQNYNWITPNTTYLKMSVVEDGMHRITRSDFTNAGISTTGIDPRTIRLLNKGVEIPIYFSGENDGTFDSPDFFDFYGTRNYGGNTIYYTVDNVPFYQKDEYYNLYSDTNSYWVSWGGANGLRYTDYQDTSSVPYEKLTFTERYHFEKDRIYSQGERITNTDYRYFNNELFQGEGWYWSRMYNGLFITENFTTPNLPDSAANCTLNFFAYPDNANLSVFNEHRIRIFINNNVVADVYKDDLTRFNSTVTFSSSLLRNDTVNRLSVYYTVTGFDGYTNLDYVDIKIPSKFRFRSARISADLGGTDSSARLFNMSGFEDAPLYIYDVKHYNRITNYTTSFDTLYFNASSNAKLEVLNSSVLKKPFKIVQRQVPDLVASANGADYIIVYHPVFESQAQQLADYRASQDGFRVVKAKVTDIYDIFNYGNQHPSAVRLFCKNAYDTWPGNKFGYLCLFGRGTFDPKKNSTSTVYDKNFVPVIGYPTTDSYFANYSLGAFTYLDKVAVGRLPVYTTTEAQAMVDNIIAYESKQPEAWMKNVLFVVGGGTATDQLFNQSLVTPFINNYVIPPTLSGNPHKAFRVDSTSTLTYNYKDSVRRDINNGDLIVNFQGHAGFQNWEDAMQEPSTLDNAGRFPFILSMTCYTGKTADNTARIFGEKFVTMSNKGSIGFLGSTGWGFVYSGNLFQDKMYYAITRDTIRRTGDIIKYGKTKISYDSVGSVTRHTINCYGLMGDPALKLSLPVRPEFHIEPDGYRLSDKFPSYGQTVTLTVYPFNYGLHSDSCKIGFTLKSDNVPVSGSDTVIRAFKFSDSVRYTFRLDSVKNYSVHVELDKDNWVSQENEDNNLLTVDIAMKNNSFVQFRPVDYEVIETDTIEFIGLNPVSDDSSFSVMLEFDTTQYFNSPLLATFIANNVSGPVTKFSTPVPVSDSGVVYFWRTNSFRSGDSTGWTNARSFSYRPPPVSGNRSFSTGMRDVSSPEVTLKKFDKEQFAVESMSNLSLSDTGIGLTSYPLNLYVRSMGSSGGEISHFFSNDQAINIDGGRSTGLNIAKVRKVDGKIIAHKFFKLFNSSSMDSVVNFLNTFDSTHFMMALNASYVDYSLVQPLNENTKAKIRSFGSTKIDSMYKFGYFDSWSFIGYLGAGPSDVSEQYFKYTSSAGWRESQSTISTTCIKTSGSVSNYAGTAYGWQSFSWTQSLVPGSSLLFDVYGITQDNTKTLLMSDLNSNELSDLSSVDARTYPVIELTGKLSVDTTTGLNSSVLGTVSVNHVLPAELVLSKNNFIVSDTVAEVGKEIKVYFDCINVGYQDVYGVAVNAYKSSTAPNDLILSDTSHAVIHRDSTARVQAKFKVPYFRTRGDGKVPLIIEVKPVDGMSEFHTYNNILKFEVELAGIGTSRQVALYSDEVLINGGEQVSSRPEIRIEIAGDIQASLTKGNAEGKQFRLSVNGHDLTHSIKRAELSDRGESRNFKNGENNTNPARFYPMLNNGRNVLSVHFTNEAGEADSVAYDVFVSDVSSVTELGNFPNPMNDKTTFLFNLTGLEAPDEVAIMIYTTSGRKIKELRHIPTLGYNHLEWDGRDDDGDFVANGTYLYRLVTGGDESLSSNVEKLVVLK